VETGLTSFATGSLSKLGRVMKTKDGYQINDNGHTTSKLWPHQPASMYEIMYAKWRGAEDRAAQYYHQMQNLYSTPKCPSSLNHVWIVLVNIDGDATAKAFRSKPDAMKYITKEKEWAQCETTLINQYWKAYNKIALNTFWDDTDNDDQFYDKVWQQLPYVDDKIKCMLENSFDEQPGVSHTLINTKVW